MNNLEDNDKMKNKVSEKAKEILEKFKETTKDSEKLLKYPDKVLKKLREAYEKADKIKEGPFNDVIEDFFLMIDLVKAYVKKEYTNIPTGSIVAILAAILYVINPFDVIPDFIPGVGILDDAFIVTMVLKQVHSDLQAFKAWQGAVKVSDN